MRILFFMPNGSRTGSTQALCNLIGYAAGKGWEMAVACRTGGELLEQLPSSVPVFVQEKWGAARRTYARLAGRARGDSDWFVTMVNAEFKPDVWYVNTIVMPEVIKQAKGQGMPCILHSHEMEHMLSYLSEDDALSLATYPELIIACSEPNGGIFRTLGRKERIEVCYETINPASIEWDDGNSRELRRSLGIGDNTFVWAMSGTLDPNKNPLRFIEIADQMLENNLDVHFVWLGGGDSGYSVYVREKARELDLHQKVTFLGTRAADYYDWLNAADGLVLTSARDSFPLVCLEAAHIGKPIVSFNSGGVKEMVREGMGVVVDSWDNANLVGAMAAVMNGDISFDARISKERVQEFFVNVQGERWMSVMREYFTSRESQARQLGGVART